MGATVHDLGHWRAEHSLSKNQMVNQPFINSPKLVNGGQGLLISKTIRLSIYYLITVKGRKVRLLFLLSFFWLPLFLLTPSSPGRGESSWSLLSKVAMESKAGGKSLQGEDEDSWEW